MKKKSITINIITFSIITIIAVLFVIKTNDKEKLSINENIVDDAFFAIYLDDNISTSMPKHSDNYSFDETKSSCNNGVTITWDEDNWTSILDFMNYKKETDTSRVSCNLYFKSTTYSQKVINCGGTAACAQKYADTLPEQLAFDATADNNLRYFGADPDNYALVDGQLWRIIGSFNNIKTAATDKVGQVRFKLIKSESIGAWSWDSSASSVNSGWGVNEWSQADIMKVLNSGTTSTSVAVYYNAASSKCYVEAANTTAPCDFRNIGLKSTMKTLISNAVWNTGGTGESSRGVWLANTLYEYERSTNTGKNCSTGVHCNDTVARKTTWVNKIALPYPSDYAFATGGGSSTTRENCLKSSTYLYGETGYTDCSENNWLFNRTNVTWTLTNYGKNTGNAANIVTIETSGKTDNTHASNVGLIYPTTYLTSTVKITSGSGTKDDPYIFAAK